MGRYRAPSPTPSAGSDAPIPETLQEDPVKPQISSGAERPRATWVVYVGNLHPEVTKVDLYNLLDGRDHIRKITIRTTRGCAVVPIPGEYIEPSYRCYASVEIIGLKRTEEVMKNYDPTNPPILLGLPVIITLHAMDLPEFVEILERSIEDMPEKTKRPNKLTQGKRRIAKQQPGQPGPLAGPSRSSAKPKPRYNPLGRDHA